MRHFPVHIAISAVLVGLLGVVLGLVPIALELEEDPGLRWLLTLRGPVPPPESVAVVAISRDSAEFLGLSTDLDEWPRAVHAQLIERLDELGAAAIVFDVMFEERGAREDAERLATAIGAAGNVLLLEWVDTPVLPPGLPPGTAVEQRVEPYAGFARAALATAPFTLPTRPLRTSQFWAFGRTDDSTPTLPTVALHAYALPVHARFIDLVRAALPDGADADLPATAQEARATGLAATVRALRLLFRAHPGLAERVGEASARISGLDPREAKLLDALVHLYAGSSTRYLNFYGPTRSIRTIPFERVLSAPIAPSDIDGRVVFVGYSELRQPSQADDFISVYSERSGLNLSGVEIGATAFANLLERSSIVPMPRWHHLLLLLAWGIGLSGLLARFRTAVAIALGLALGAALLAFSGWRLAADQAWWPVVVPLGVQLPAALCLAAYWNHRRLSRQRERIQTALGYYVPAPVLGRLVRESVEQGARRELVYGTCLVSDAERFTSLSEQLRADELGELMEAYYRTLSAAAERHGGFIADVSGDSIVAVWTAVRSQEDAKRRACAAALEMRAAIDAFNVEHAPRRLPTGFGLDSGEVLVGNIEISHRYQYRAVGDIVNTASRIQGLNRLLGTQVLASAETLGFPDAPHTRRLGRFLLLGKATPIEVHELLETAAAAWVARFDDGLRAFAAGRWQDARASFGAVLAACPADGPARFYLDQCARRGDAPPPPDWTGTVAMTVK